MKYIAKITLFLCVTFFSLGSSASNMDGFTNSRRARQNKLLYSSIAMLKNDYVFVLFYSTNCPHCTSFAPVLKKYAYDCSIPVQAFATGQAVSPNFPNSIIVPQDTIDQFFGSGSELSVPTLFILNKHNYHAYPVAKGSLTYLELNNRMNILAPKVLKHEQKFA